jgi:surfactin synthase thioesterase subunit
MASRTGSWAEVTAGAKFHWPGEACAAEVVLYAFGQAGTGAGAWGSLRGELAGDVDMRAVRLAGRESRFGEQPPATVPAQVADLAGDLAGLVRSDDRGYVLLGHCSGAVTAFETARALRDLGVREPAALAVVDQVAPAELADLLDPVHLFSAARFRQWCLDTLPERPELGDDEIFEFFEPVLRADFCALSTYEYKPEPLLACPVVVLRRGEPDLAALARWGEVTTGQVTVKTTTMPTEAASLAWFVRDILPLAGGLPR